MQEGFEQVKKLSAASDPCQAELTKKPGCCRGVCTSWKQRVQEQHGSRTRIVQKKKRKKPQTFQHFPKKQINAGEQEHFILEKGIYPTGMGYCSPPGRPG